MAPLVLVHGAWHGGWCWSRVAATLTSCGVDVLTPTLAGLGERAAELDRSIGLRTHVDDVVAVLDAADEPVVLVGHSYSGLVVREAADRRPDAVARLVLVDAWVGGDGATLVDLAPDWMSEALLDAARRSGDGWFVPAPDPALVGVDDPVDAAFLRDRLTAHPLATFTDATRLRGAVDGIDTLAVTAAPSVLPFRDLAIAAGWPATPVSGGHDLMLTAPDELSEILLGAADAAGAVDPTDAVGPTDAADALDAAGAAG